MEDNTLDSSSEVTLKELFEKNEEKERKKKAAERMREYRIKNPQIDEKRKIRKTTQLMTKKFSELGKVDHHKICKKLATGSGNARPRPGSKLFKCKTCDVSYQEKQQKFFWKKIYCPCCKRKLSTRKSVSEKKLNPDKIKRISA